jgi:GAF domain-containing protein
MNNQLPRGGREQLLARAFVSLADNLVDDYDVIELLTRLVGYSVQLLGADAGGIMLADPHGQLRVVAASDEHAELIELMQLQNDQGPCLTCYHAGAPVSVADLGEATDRWPKFIPAAMNQNVFRAVHAVPLRLRGEAIGALTLCHHDPSDEARFIKGHDLVVDGGITSGQPGGTMRAAWRVLDDAHNPPATA